MVKSYPVPPLSSPNPRWEYVNPAYIENIMGEKPAFMPHTELRLSYDREFIYGRFNVKDKFVLSRTTVVNGPVSDDSCVEFFFAPNALEPTHYFNLEINASGTALMFFIRHPWSDFRTIDPDDIRQIDIIHSLPEPVMSEIEEETDWSIEFRIPLLVLRKYAELTEPEAGVIWKANFYKTATNTSNPHYLTWNRVEFEKPNFHLPEYFGEIVFQ